MKVIVNPHKIELVKDELINEKEIDITRCYFEFNDIPSDYVKEAYFTYGNSTYKQIIQNDECSIPYEVLEKKGDVELGVVCFEVQDEQTIKRYNPSPVYFSTLIGSLKNAQNSEPITPTDKEQIEQMLDNIDIDANKVGKITTITITNKDGTTQEVTLEDGKSIEYNWVGTQLGIRQEGESSYEYVDLKGDKGDAGAIKFEIVQQLPTQDIKEDTIYLVPITPDISGNNYEEYIYINGQWELLGKIGVQIDLTDYVKNTDYAGASKGGVIKINSGTFATAIFNGQLTSVTKDYTQAYPYMSTEAFISKGTLENVITGKDLTTKAYVDSLVGDIDSALDSIQGEII